MCQRSLHGSVSSARIGRRWVLEELAELQGRHDALREALRRLADEAPDSHS